MEPGPALSPAFAPEVTLRTCALDKRTTLLLVTGAFLLFPVAFVLFGALAARLWPTYHAPAIVLGPGAGLQLLGLIASIVALNVLLSAALLVLHEYCHGLGFQWAGATPRYGAKLLHKVVPIFYAASPGFRTSCRQFRVILLVPTVVVNAAGLVLMWPPTPLRYLLVLPLAAHLGGCVGDWWMLYVLRSTPADSLVEDTPEGFRYQSHT